MADTVSARTKTAREKHCDVHHKCAEGLVSTRASGPPPRVAITAFLRVLACASIFFLPGGPVNAATQAEAEARQAEAEAAQAALLSPGSYVRGTEAMSRARASTDSSARQQALADALNAFDAALDTAAQARDVLSDALAGRAAANEAEAFRLATGDWARAEKRLNDAVRALERGNLPAARKRAQSATELYREAQLNALKGRYLTTARDAIVEAERMKAGRLAPRSLARARELLASAETSLASGTQDNTQAAELADQATYHARLAGYIAGQAQRIRAKEATVEDLVLENQAVLGRLAETAGTSADFSEGPAKAETQLRKRLERVPVLEAELQQSRRQVAGLEEEIRELDQRLGSASAERRDLMQRVEADARVREQFAMVQSLFAPQEAAVLRDGDDLILRMVGLRFPSGSAQLDDDAKTLLDRLDNAIDVFPRCAIQVEGHTDSSGRPKRNQVLSQERATAVANYLVETTGIQAFRVTATGYGDSRPVTSNRTREGRAQNRRIDVVITPKLNNTP